MMANILLLCRGLVGVWHIIKIIIVVGGERERLRMVTGQGIVLDPGFWSCILWDTTTNNHVLLLLLLFPFLLLL